MLDGLVKTIHNSIHAITAAKAAVANNQAKTNGTIVNSLLINVSNKLPQQGAVAFAHGQELGAGLPCTLPGLPARCYQWIRGFYGQDCPGGGCA